MHYYPNFLLLFITAQSLRNCMRDKPGLPVAHIEPKKSFLSFPGWQLIREDQPYKYLLNLSPVPVVQI